MRAQILPRTILLALLGLAAGCLPNKQYRVGPAAIERHPAGNGGYDLAYVEFDEQGDFWDREQLARAVSLIKATRKPLLVVYVHGWQNNANDSFDVGQFHDVLATLAQAERVRELEYQVVGVYLGWRGKQAYDPLLKVLSFKNRKDAAVRIGSSNTITEAIFRVVYEARHRPQPARTILIGHSFGALVVERAVEQAMTGGLLTGKPVVPADFILLVNSAAESIYAKEMRDMMEATLSFDNYRKCYQAPDDPDCFMKDEPRIISVTSETDRATGMAFPIGATLFGFGKLYRDYSPHQTGGARINQRLFFTHTPGHNDFLLDHAIVPLDIAPPLPHRSRAFEENLEHPQARPASGADAQATPIFATGGGPPNEWKWWRLNYTGNPEKRSLFWIVKVPKQILNGHGDIFNPAARDMMAALFRLSNVLDRGPAPAPAIMVKDKPASVGQPLAEAVPLAAPASSPEATSAPSTARAQRPRKRRARKPDFLQLVRRVPAG
jgi:pimeloyl-ACP methyl ester carboxylesterase